LKVKACPYVLVFTLEGIVMKEQFTQLRFERYRDFIRQEFGITFSSEKKDMLQNKLDAQMHKDGYDSYDKYLNMLRKANRNTIAKFAACITVHKTDFFREPHHFSFIDENWSKFLAMGRSRQPHQLRVWSAGCSTGEEPYTLAMVLAERCALNNIGLRILATDLSNRVLSKAKEGRYPVGASIDIGQDYLEKYFYRIDSGEIEVVPELKALITFRQFNLLDPFPFQGTFDLILCRNVMIYFDIETQVKLVQDFFDVTSPGGFLFIGHSESLNNRGRQYSYIQPTVYRKKA